MKKYPISTMSPESGKQDLYSSVQDDCLAHVCLKMFLLSCSNGIVCMIISTLRLCGSSGTIVNTELTSAS